MKHSLFFHLLSMLLGTLLFGSCASCVVDKSPLLHTSSGALLRVADPCVWQADGLYYLSASDEAHHGFCYYTSRDLQVWDSCGILFSVPDDEPVRTMLWASEVAAHDGKYYLTYSGWNPRTNNLTISLAVATSPAGPFLLVASPWISVESRNVIDANLFWDWDGTPYVYLSENGGFDGYAGGELRVARLQSDMSGLVTPLFHVCDTFEEWELRMAKPCDHCNEAPEVFRVDTTYYMLYSANETHNGHYGMGVQTAPTPLGPWTKEPSNPLLQTDYEGSRRPCGLPVVSSPGHGGVIPSRCSADAPADYSSGWIIYHRHAPWVEAYPSNDRVTCLTTYRIVDGKLRIPTDWKRE